MNDYLDLPPDLPVPKDDGSATHLVGRAVPADAFASTNGGEVQLSPPGSGLSVVYIYPLTGRPGVGLPKGWDDIPGARGCTPESCGFRDHFDEIREAGADRVHGLSAQSSEYQAEAAERLGLPFSLVSDPMFVLADALGIPTFTVERERFYVRITLILREGVVDHVFYPVFPPDQHAAQVTEWLRGRKAAGGTAGRSLM